MLANTETVVQDAGALGTGGFKKRLKQKGNAHVVRWDILDNEDIKGEEGWEVEMEEYWTSKTSKKYVKMYHVDKLWPRGCHEMNTKSFTQGLTCATTTTSFIVLKRFRGLYLGIVKKAKGSSITACCQWYTRSSY